MTNKDIFVQEMNRLGVTPKTDKNGVVPIVPNRTQPKGTVKERALDHYIHTINQIDDYFEYQYDSEQDKRVVMSLIDQLTEKLTKVN